MYLFCGEMDAAMTKAEIIESFDPNGVGLRNGQFIGLPFDSATAEIILLPIPWDVTVSYKAGTSGGPENIRQASVQLDLFDPDIQDAWKLGIYFEAEQQDWSARNQALRPIAARYIQSLEEPNTASLCDYAPDLKAINAACDQLRAEVKDKAAYWLNQGKLVGLVGGDHSTPLGLMQALAEHHSSFGILHIDAHMDLRESYEGFTFSHASIFYNALKIKNITQLTQVGIRDYCEEEFQLAQSLPERVSVFYDQDLKEAAFLGKTWHTQCLEIVDTLPEKVYISFDIDGLDPALCPNTGTPVAGGFTLAQAFYLLKLLVASKRTIIGFDLNETAGEGHEWDANVAARLLYKLCNWTGRSNKKI